MKTALALVLLLSFPDRPTGPVNDFAHALTPVQLSQLDAQLRGYERGTTRQIAFAIFRSLDGESLEDVSVRLAERWKIGGKASSDGVLVTLFLDDHKMRIEVGYGLEGQLTDAVSARILREVVAPRMQKGDLFGALTACAAAIDSATGGGPHDEDEPPPTSGAGKVGLPIGLIVGGILFIGLMIISSTFRSIVWAILQFLWLFGGSGRGGFSGGGGGWSGGSGGGGSWSGGGGSFGGGGASGSW